MGKNPPPLPESTELKNATITDGKQKALEQDNKNMEKKDLRIIFMGTPEFAVETLSALTGHGYNVVAVVTQPDKPSGRHQDTLQPPPVKRFAEAKGIPVMQPEKMRDPMFIEELRQYAADLQIVVAFRILPEVVWNMPRYGTFNVHASLLPQYRGAAPINWAVINGETRTGVTTFFLDRDIDTGRIIMQKTFDIGENDNAREVHDGLMRLGAAIALETTNRIIAGNGCVESMPQELLTTEHGPLHTAPKIFKDTCRINWNTHAKNIHDFVRGLSPAPGAWTMLTQQRGKTAVLKIFRTTKTTAPTDSDTTWHDSTLPPPGTMVSKGKDLYIAATDSLIKIEELQLAGKKRMTARDFINGMRSVEGMKAE